MAHVTSQIKSVPFMLERSGIAHWFWVCRLHKYEIEEVNLELGQSGFSDLIFYLQSKKSPQTLWYVIKSSEINLIQWKNIFERFYIHDQ